MRLSLSLISPTLLYSRSSTSTSAYFSTCGQSSSQIQYSPCLLIIQIIGSTRWITICDHLDEERSLDLLSSSGEPWPPLLRNCPRKAMTYLSWLPRSSFSMLAYFWFRRASQWLRSLVCSSRPVLIFFCRAASQAACLALRVLMEVYILRLRALNQASFSTLSSSANLVCTLWASVYLHRLNHYSFCLAMCSSIFLRLRNSEDSLTLKESCFSSSALRLSHQFWCLPSMSRTIFSPSCENSLSFLSQNPLKFLSQSSWARLRSLFYWLWRCSISQMRRASRSRLSCSEVSLQFSASTQLPFFWCSCICERVWSKAVSIQSAERFILISLILLFY